MGHYEPSHPNGPIWRNFRPCSRPLYSVLGVLGPGPWPCLPAKLKKPTEDDVNDIQETVLMPQGDYTFEFPILVRTANPMGSQTGL